MTSVSVIVIDKVGNVKESKIKAFSEEELYKKAGFKSASDFKNHVTWNDIRINGKIFNINVYGKTSGRANQENQYEFPPPIDNTLFFGSCVIVNKNKTGVEDISVKEWNKIYDHLYGGFDDLCDDDEEESEDEDEDLPKTKSGYAKDDFIVDDDECDDDECDDEEYESKTSKSKCMPPKTPRRAKANTVFIIEESDSDSDSDYTCELEEEEYI